MMECEIAWEVHPYDHSRLNKPPPMMVPVQLGKRTVTALLNMGSFVSLVRAHLVPQDHSVLLYITLAGVYQCVCQWPVVQLTLGYNGQTHLMDMLKVDDLSFPVLLSHNAPDFDVLLRDALPPATTAGSKDEEARPSNMDSDNDGTPGAVGWSINAEFQAAQSTDPTLEAAPQALALKEDIVVDEHQAGRLLRSEQVRGILWWVVAVKQRGGMPWRQLLVPFCY